MRYWRESGRSFIFITLFYLLKWDKSNDPFLFLFISGIVVQKNLVGYKYSVIINVNNEVKHSSVNYYESDRISQLNRLERKSIEY